MTHPLVEQLRFTRSEFVRALNGVSDDEARRHFGPMNCISWIVGHLAWHEQLYWLERGQGRVLLPQLHELTANGAPASTPAINEMWSAWQTIAEASDPYLDTLTTAAMSTHMIVDGEPHAQNIGTMLRRVTYHYWFHIGESQAIRQMLGHVELPEFVGDIHIHAPYQPE